MHYGDDGSVRLCVFLSAGLFFCNIVSAGQTTAAIPSPPKIEDLLKANVFSRVSSSREVLSYADIEDAPSDPDRKKGDEPLRNYRFYTVAQVNASVSEATALVRKPEILEKLIPFVDLARYDDKKKEIEISGGIWNYGIHSWLSVDEKCPGWTRFVVVKGHFLGMIADILIEPNKDRGVLVYFGGQSSGRVWPPAFILERGGEVVLGFSAKRMRKYIEEDRIREGEKKNEPTGYPTPGRSLKINSRERATPGLSMVPRGPAVSNTRNGQDIWCPGYFSEWDVAPDYQTG